VSIPVPFGQYVAADSPLHRLDARAKLAVSAAFAVALFALDGWLGLAICATAVALLIAVSRVPWRLALRGLVPILWILGFTVAINALRWRPDEAWLMLGPVGIDADGLARGLFFSARIVVLVAGTSLVTLTTSPVALTDALASLMRPLGVVRFPVDDVAMMLSIALRFLPVTAEEAERLVVAQTARGARFDQGGLVARTRAWVPVLIPLFVRLFRRADDLAVAMEARCYTGIGRTRLRVSVMRVSDWVTIVAGVGASIAMGVWL